MAEPIKMSLREAVDIAVGREPSDGVRWEYARDLLYAAAEAHDATVSLEGDPESIALSLARGRAYMELRSLERGEGAT